MGSTEALHARLRELLDPVLVSLGYELVELEYRPESGGWVVRCYIDKPGGVNLDDCATVSREISTLLEVEDLIPHAYNLEVSSPGLDRPLVKPTDFERFAGQRVKVRMREALDPEGRGTPRKVFMGDLLGLEGERIRLRLEGKAGVEIELPLASIERARLDPVF